MSSEIEPSLQEAVTVTEHGSDFRFSVQFRGVETLNAARYRTEQEAFEAGRKMLATMKALYLQTLTRERQ